MVVKSGLTMAITSIPSNGLTKSQDAGIKLVEAIFNAIMELWQKSEDGASQEDILKALRNSFGQDAIKAAIGAYFGADIESRQIQIVYDAVTKAVVIPMWERMHA